MTAVPAVSAAVAREALALLAAAYEVACALPCDADTDLLCDLLDATFRALGFAVGLDLAPDPDAAAVLALDPCREPATGRRRLAEAPLDELPADGDTVPF